MKYSKLLQKHINIDNPFSPPIVFLWSKALHLLACRRTELTFTCRTAQSPAFCASQPSFYYLYTLRVFLRLLETQNKLLCYIGCQTVRKSTEDNFQLALEPHVIHCRAPQQRIPGILLSLVGEICYVCLPRLSYVQPRFFCLPR